MPAFFFPFHLHLRANLTTGRDEEATFLSSIKPLWRGFIQMHAVAKLVTKAFPVSGIMDNMTEVKEKKKTKGRIESLCRGSMSIRMSFFLLNQQDLPDSVQVGGRISPQIVWDYLEKIRAMGTKV